MDVITYPCPYSDVGLLITKYEYRNANILIIQWHTHICIYTQWIVIILVSFWPFTSPYCQAQFDSRLHKPIPIASIYVWPSTSPISQIPQCTCPISHNTPFRTDMYTILFWVVYGGIWDRCIVGFISIVSCVLWDMGHEHCGISETGRSSSLPGPVSHVIRNWSSTGVWLPYKGVSCTHQ